MWPSFDSHELRCGPHLIHINSDALILVQNPTYSSISEPGSTIAHLPCTS